MTKIEMVENVTMENMKHILPIIRTNAKIMGTIQAKLTKDAAANNQIIIGEIINAINTADDKCFANDGFIYTLTTIFG